MIQRAKRLPGELAPCVCGRQPYHVTQGPRHFLECPPCSSRTAKFDTLQEAVQAWGASEVVETVSNVVAIRRSA